MWRFSLIYNIFRLRKGGEVMAVIYATLIIMEAKTFAQVPNTLKAQVKQVLEDLEMGHLAE